MNVRLMCQVLGDAGYHVDLLVFPTGKNIALRNVKIIRLPTFPGLSSIPVGPSYIKLIYDVAIFIASFWLLLCKDYDIIHGIEEGGFLAVFWAALFRKSSIFDVDSSISDQLHYSGFIRHPFLIKIVKRLERLSFKMGTAVITVCQALSDKVRAQYPRANIHQIEDIPILSEKPTAKRGHEKLKTAFSLGDSHRVVYTGNLEAYQGIDLLIQSHQRLMTMDLKRNDCKLIIVGGSPAQIEHYKRKYDDDKIKKGSIIWVGQRPSQEMALWMELSHVLVSPRSEGENTPLKIYTYMSSGRPIVATRRLTHLQVLNDSVVFLAEPDPESFSAAIYAALHDKESSLQKAKNAKKLVEDHYSFRVFRKKLLEAYSFVERSSGRML